MIYCRVTGKFLWSVATFNYRNLDRLASIDNRRWKTDLRTFEHYGDIPDAAGQA